MPPLLSKPSSIAPTSIFYVTLGALLTVWGVIWLVYLNNHPPRNDVWNYVDYIVLATGVVILVIGMGAGRIGRAAREAELPPKDPEASETAARRS